MTSKKQAGKRDGETVEVGRTGWQHPYSTLHPPFTLCITISERPEFISHVHLSSQYDHRFICSWIGPLFSLSLQRKWNNRPEGTRVCLQHDDDDDDHFKTHFTIPRVSQFIATLFWPSIKWCNKCLQYSPGLGLFSWNYIEQARDLGCEINKITSGLCIQFETCYLLSLFPPIIFYEDHCMFELIAV